MLMSKLVKNGEILSLLKYQGSDKWLSQNNISKLLREYVKLLRHF